MEALKINPEFCEVFIRLNFETAVLYVIIKIKIIKVRYFGNEEKIVLKIEGFDYLA